MKEFEKIILDKLNVTNNSDYLDFVQYKDLLYLMRESYNMAIELAAKKAEIDCVLDEEDGQAFDKYVVNEYSILRLKLPTFIEPIEFQQT